MNISTQKTGKEWHNSAKLAYLIDYKEQINQRTAFLSKLKEEKNVKKKNKSNEENQHYL